VATADRTKQAPGSSGEFESFVAAWEGFFAAIRRARGRVAQTQGDELSLSQHHLLSALAEDTHLRIGELALAAGVAPPTATRMLDALERDGVVKRESSPDDRRAVEVRLTAKGRRRLDEKRRLVESKRRALFDSLTPSEREQAEQLLGHMAELIEEL
jgi:MarR family transcriptional regulator, organic hydroperoxide resistance regulator